MPSIKEQALAAFGPSVLKRSALNIRDGEGVLRHILTRGRRYGTVLEIGTYKGVGAACIAQHCDKVITIDLLHGRLEQVGEHWDRWAFWRSLGVDHKVELHLLRDGAEKADLIRTLSFDLAFIDGGKHDVAEDFESVKRCGAVLFHDYDFREGPDVNTVYDFVNSLPPDHVELMDIFALWTV